MIIGGFQPLSLCDFPGTPAAVVFTQGCNWKCPFCHNRSLWECGKKSSLSVDQLLSYLVDRRRVLKGVVFTGGEPTLHNDLHQVLLLIKQIGYKIKLDSNGSEPERIYKLLDANLLDYIAMDIKAPWSKYSLLTGVKKVNITNIKRSIQIISQSEIDHEFRTTHPPHLLDNQDLENLRTFLPINSLHKVQTYRAFCKRFILKQ